MPSPKLPPRLNGQQDWLGVSESEEQLASQYHSLNSTCPCSINGILHQHHKAP